MLAMVLEKTLRYIVLAGLFALPFVVWIVTPSLFFPYITGKNFAFRIIVEIIASAWLALALVCPPYRPKRNWILAAFALFVVVLAVADLQGVNPFKSFWSNFERMDGWVTLAHLLVYLVVAVSVLNSENLWRRLWQTSLCISMILSVYGLLQVAGILALGQVGSGGLAARVDATFGNPIYLAAYLLFHIFIAALLWVQMWSERPAGKRLPLSIWYGGAIALDMAAFLFTGTRGTMLGLLGGALLSALIFLLLARSSKTAWRLSVGLVAFIVVVSGGFWLIRGASWVRNVGFLDRLATISLSDSTVKARFLNISIAWQGVKERPILGWGQENYAIVFDKYYDPRMYGQEPWFDRVHDIIFDWWIAGGTLGLLAYLSIFAATLWALWRKNAAFSVGEKSILTGLVAGYFFHNLFVFDNITSYICFVMLLGYIIWRSSADEAPLVQGKFLPEKTLPVISVLAALLVWGSAWFVNANALAQNRALLGALEAGSRGDASAVLDDFTKAAAYGTYGTQEVREQLVQASSNLAANSNVPLDIKQKFFDTAAREMSLQAKASPLDARFPLFLGILFDSYGDFADGAQALGKAHELSPKKQSILFEMAANAQNRGDPTSALSFSKQAFDLGPQFTDARLLYAALAIRAGQDTLADELLVPVIATGDAADPRISAAYATRNRFDKIAAIWAAHVKAQPHDIPAYLTLAAAYYAGGNSAQAIATLQAAETVAPQSKDQAEALIQQIRNGTAKIH